MKNFISRSLLVSGVAIATFSPAAVSDIQQATAMQNKTGVLASYERLLPLEGGSNFRDMGGYKTTDGKTVRKGLLYRSGVMSHLTKKDEAFLNNINFETVVDLRSSEELDLYPNSWAKNAKLNYVHVDYSMREMLSAGPDQQQAAFDMSHFYRSMAYTLKPQLKQYFDNAIQGKAPLVVNCSAGQDRTGIASALMLTALGVPREHIVQDYVLSTEYRRPHVERGNVDLAAKAETNAFAQVMLRYADEGQTKTSPLITGSGIPFIYYTFKQLEEDHGSVLTFLEKELDVSEKDIATLRNLYLQ